MTALMSRTKLELNIGRFLSHSGKTPLCATHILYINLSCEDAQNGVGG